jgi:hypothetical protein
MSVNTFACPKYILDPLEELADNEIIESSVMIYSNPGRVQITLARDIDSRWRMLTVGHSVIVLIYPGPFIGKDDLLMVLGDDRDQIDDNFFINTKQLPAWEKLRLALTKWKYDGIDPVQGQ